MKSTVSRLAELGLSEGAKCQLRYRFGELEGVQPCMKEPMKVMERRIKRWRRVGSSGVAGTGGGTVPAFERKSRAKAELSQSLRTGRK